MEPNVLYEDDDVVVIDKPAGLIVHSDGRTEEPSVAEWAARAYPAMTDVGESWTSPQGEVVPRPGIVHRLDRSTSGVMVLAKTAEAHAFLKAEFQDRRAKKEYRAFVYGRPRESRGTIEAEIVRIRSVPPRWGIRRPDEGKKHRAAVTEWRLEGEGEDPETKEPVAYLSLFPKTGRTHQLRVHLKYLGYPIIADPLYARERPPLLGFMRPALHAFRLGLALPSGGERTFEAPLPEDFSAALRAIAAP